jgi:hypothetical protein
MSKNNSQNNYYLIKLIIKFQSNIVKKLSIRIIKFKQISFSKRKGQILYRIKYILKLLIKRKLHNCLLIIQLRRFNLLIFIKLTE